MSRPVQQRGRRPATRTVEGRSSLVDEARAAREQALLHAAGEVLSRHGPEGFNVREVARSVGASTMVVYTLFGGREGLLDALTQEGLDRLASAYDRVPAHDSLAGLAQIARAYRRFAIANRHYYNALFAAPRSNALVRESRAYRILVDAVRGCIERGALASATPEAVADALWGLVHGMVSLELAGHFSSAKLAEERFLSAGEALLNGLRAM
jgi:AcrR family transcriptional regulator